MAVSATGGSGLGRGQCPVPSARFGIAAASTLFGDQLGLMFAVSVVLILGSLSVAVANKRSAPEVAAP